MARDDLPSRSSHALHAPHLRPTERTPTRSLMRVGGAAEALIAPAGNPARSTMNVADKEMELRPDPGVLSLGRHG